ncbi:hypothetical protein I8748_32275 [Nostoc sp. CENA67]|uniref:Uncharacterized protein n=1 Tax=Amazonocrinis nigriterrae CENA67 TaxID=2794033 RepID=A0A8J7HYX3_9NOST|nr:hypothetical protein [Amazonocrinis nigriterrae]MBH8566775.1 hypothetical protein [Amazonocrinis nigriterrae CENA67]
MNVIEILRLKQLRFQVASQLVLKEWKPEDLSKPKCPKCYSPGFLTPHQSQDSRVCYCIRCNYYFKEIIATHSCKCAVPGDDKVCCGCPYFQQFMELVDQRLVELEQLSVAELQDLLSLKPFP